MGLVNIQHPFGNSLAICYSTGMIESTAEEATFLDSDLHVYTAEISVFISRTTEAKEQLKILWNIQDSCASEIARDIRKSYGIRDNSLRQSLKISAITSLYSVLNDNQSKCFARILSLYKKGPLNQILLNLYKPLWEAYEVRYKAEILRLSVNRNNYYAHISKKKPTNEILTWEGIPGKYTIINYSDIISDINDSIFSSQSVRYLNGLQSLLSMAQEQQIFETMVKNIPQHLNEFKSLYPLNK